MSRYRLHREELSKTDRLTHFCAQGVPDYDFEFSELLTYYVTLIEETGDYTDALQLLENYAKDRSIIDKTAILTIKGELS